jgi:hypothetical protein
MDEQRGLAKRLSKKRQYNVKILATEAPNRIIPRYLPCSVTFVTAIATSVAATFVRGTLVVTGLLDALGFIPFMLSFDSTLTSLALVRNSNS